MFFVTMCAVFHPDQGLFVVGAVCLSSGGKGCNRVTGFFLCTSRIFFSLFFVHHGLQGAWAAQSSISLLLSLLKGCKLKPVCR